MTDPKPSQLDKFKEAARALECDEDEDRFKAKLRKVAKAPRPPKAEKPADAASASIGRVGGSSVKNTPMGAFSRSFTD